MMTIECETIEMHDDIFYVQFPSLFFFGFFFLIVMWSRKPIPFVGLICVYCLQKEEGRKERRKDYEHPL